MSRFLLACLVGLAAIASTPASAADLRVASAYDPQTMDPHSLALLYHTRVVFQVYEGLVGRDEHDRLAPALATGWKRTSPITWRFALRPDVRFHDGERFDADDAVFSLDRAAAAPSQRAFLLHGVKAVRKVDALTIDVELSEPDAEFPAKLVLVAMMSRDWCALHHVERALDFNARQETFASRNADGTGPYRLERYDPDARTVLRAFEGWWGRSDRHIGNVDQAEFVTIRSDASRLAALHSGEVDVVLDPPYQALEAISRDPALSLARGDSLSTQMLAFDLHDATLPGVEPNRDGLRNPFRDRRVREAVYRAVNVDLLVQKVLRGAGTATGTLFAPRVEGDVPELEWRRRYDPAEARRLLAQAGWPRGFDVQFDCVNTGYREQGCRAMAAMLAQAGIRADLHVWPGTEFFPKITQGTIHLAEFGYTAATDAWQNLNGLLHSWDGHGAGTFNASRFASPRIDALIDRIRTEDDPGRRETMIGDVLRTAAADLPYVPLYRPQIVWAVGRRVQPAMRPDDTIALRWTSLR